MSTSLMSSSSGRFATSIVEMLRFAHTHTHTRGNEHKRLLIVNKTPKRKGFIFFNYFFGVYLFVGIMVKTIDLYVIIQ